MALQLTITAESGTTVTLSGGASGTVSGGQTRSFSISSATTLTASGAFNAWTITVNGTVYTNFDNPWQVTSAIISNYSSISVVCESSSGGGDEPDPGGGGGDNTSYHLRVYRANESATAVTLIEAGGTSATLEEKGSATKWIDVSSVTGDSTVWVSVASGWVVSGFYITRRHNNTAVETTGSRSSQYDSRYDQYYYEIDSDDYGDADDIEIRVVVAEESAPSSDGYHWLNIGAGSANWHKVIVWLNIGGGTANWYKIVVWIDVGGGSANWKKGG